MNIKKIFMFVVLLHGSIIFGQDSLKLEWSRMFFGPNSHEDEPKDMVLDNDGNIIVLGDTRDLFEGKETVIVKYSPQGDELWTSYYRGKDSVYAHPSKIDIDPLGNIFVAGDTYNEGELGDFFIIKINKNTGEKIWERIYEYQYWDRLLDMDIDTNGSVYATGHSYIKEGDYDFLTIAYSSDGEFRWANTYSETDNSDDRGMQIEVSANGDIIVVGRSSSPFISDFMTTIRYDKNGNELWKRQKTNNLGFLLGVDENDNSYSYGGSILKHNIDGELKWTISVSQIEPEAVFLNISELKVDKRKNIYLTGLINNENPSNEFLTLKYDTDGNLKWSAKYNENGTGYGKGFSIDVDIAGNSYVVGGGSGINNDITLLKYDSLGHLVNHAKFDYANDYDSGRKVLIDAEQNIYVLGLSYYDNYHFGMVLLKYTQKNISSTDYSVNSTTPQQFILYNNYPNPFNPGTYVRFYIRESMKVKIKIYNCMGELIKRVVEGNFQSGIHEIYWNSKNEQGKDVSSGIYYFSCQTEYLSKVQKMILIR